MTHIVHLKPQYLFVYYPNGELGVDFIGRVENMDTDWDRLIRMIGVPNTPLPKLNTTKVDEDAERLNVPNEEWLRRLYDRDFALFYGPNNCQEGEPSYKI